MSIIKFKNNKFSVDLKDEVDRSVANEIFKFREYRAAEKTIESSLEPIFDVGAHIGLFSLYIRALNSKVPIVALEPEMDNFSRLEETINRNGIQNIQLENIALAAKAGKRQLFVAADSQNHRLLAASEMFVGTRVQATSAVSLSEYCVKNKIKKIGLVKLDIEGGEFELLKNWTNKDFALFSAILLEYHDSNNNNHKELIRILSENKFGVQSFTSRFDRKLGFIFAKKKI